MIVKYGKILQGCSVSRLLVVKNFSTARTNHNYESIKMSFNTYGSKTSQPPIIIMHGLLGSKANWHSLAKVINKRTARQVFVVDTRNHGESPHHEIMNYEAIACDVFAFLKDINQSRTILVGHSMGGRGLMAVALTKPECVEKLVAVDISPYHTSADASNILMYLNVLKDIKLSSNLSLSQERKQIDEHLQAFISSQSIRQFLLTNLVETKDKVIKWQVDYNILLNNIEPILNFPTFTSKYEGPTLFIGGGNSNYIKREDHEAIRKLFPKATFTYIPNAGHWVHSENPQAFLNIICPFIGESN